MKIWFDIITPKQVLFAETMIKRLRPRHRLLCTTRRYREANGLAALRRMKLRVVGRHGGRDRFAKLQASADRVKGLAAEVSRFSPDMAVSFSSPEAARVAFGLGIYHVTFSNTPNAHAAMRLCAPFVQKMIIPNYIPKRYFTQHGIRAADIITYNGMDEYLIVKAAPRRPAVPPLHLPKPRTVLVRTYESEASYAPDVEITDMIGALVAGLPDCNIVVLGRYSNEIRALKKSVGSGAIIVDRVVDSASLLKRCDVLVGSGGTMTTEAALHGIPTITYGVVPNPTERHLMASGLLKLRRTPAGIVRLARDMLDSDTSALRARAASMMDGMEDPFTKLEDIINSRIASGPPRT